MHDIKKLFNQQIFFYLLAGFFALRLLSFILVDYSTLENWLTGIIILSLIFVYYKNPLWAWYFLLTEIFIGGAGQFLSLGTISLRSWILIIFIILYAWDFVFRGKFKKIKIPKIAYYLILPFLILILSSALIGLANHHPLNQIIADLIPFTYLLLIIPAIDFWSEKKTKEFLFNGVLVLIIASSVWSLFNFILFTSGFHLIHDDYYKWLRDINLGKITQVTQYYYRIVFPEHLLIVPLILIIGSHWLKYKDKLIYWLITAASLILALNFSRGYLLGLLIGLLFLKYKHSWKDWLKISLINLLAIGIIFTGINFVSSGGKSLGLEIAGLRLSSLTVPTIEESSNNRLLLLPAITKSISQQPIIGNGLGQTLEFINAKGKIQHTAHFDWGYLEMWSEWGFVALFVFLMLILTTLTKLIKHKNQVLSLGLLAGLISLLVINLTAPALFHVLGVVYLTLLLSLTWRHENQF